MQLDDPTRAEVRAAVQRNLEIYHRVVARRQQQSQQPEHPSLTLPSNSVESNPQPRSGTINSAVVAL